MSKYVVAFCALKERDHKLLELLVSLPAAKRFQFLANKTTFSHSPNIAIVDTGSPLSLSTFDELRRRFVHVVPVAIVDVGETQGTWRHTVRRPSLLRDIFKVLNTVADAELPATERVYVPPGTDSTRVIAQADSDRHAVADVAFVTGGSGMPEPLRALVVDDSLAVREQLRDGLDRLGFRCDEAIDAAEAQTCLARGIYDLALLDVVMPGMDGYELCRKIKQDPYRRNMPVVMLTSRTSPFDRARGMLAGCDTYMAKPITWDEFRAAIDKALLKNSSNSRAKLASRGYAGSA